MYKLIDGYNGDTVCISHAMRIVAKKAKEYDECCEGDWMPILFIKNEEGKFVRISSEGLF